MPRSPSCRQRPRRAPGRSAACRRWLLGSGLIAAVIALAGLSLAFAEPPEWIALTSQVLSLAAVTAYFVGFAPPAILQRGWQEPAIRSALARAPELVRLADPHDIGDGDRDRSAGGHGRTGIGGRASGTRRPACCSSASRRASCSR